MQEYETCLISLTGKIALVSTNRYFSDAAAIRAARLLCKQGEMAQVWRGDQCVYDENLAGRKTPAA